MTEMNIQIGNPTKMIPETIVYADMAEIQLAEVTPHNDTVLFSLAGIIGFAGIFVLAWLITK